MTLFFHRLKKLTMLFLTRASVKLPIMTNLRLEVWTDGSVKPEDAIAYSAKILKQQLDVFINFEEVEEEIIPEKEDEQDNINKVLLRSVEDLELSVRSANCLKNAGINTIGELVKKTEAEMLKTKNFGRKSLSEIKDILNEYDLTFGMDIDSAHRELE